MMQNKSYFVEIMPRRMGLKTGILEITQSQLGYSQAHSKWIKEELAHAQLNLKMKVFLTTYKTVSSTKIKNVQTLRHASKKRTGFIYYKGSYGIL